MPEQKKSTILDEIRHIFQPRMLLMVWMGLGGLLIAWVLIGASFSGAPKRTSDEGVNVADFVTGEMRDFELTFPPRGMPFTPFQGPQGELTLNDVKGKVTLVNIWATWCAPCVEELPSLNALAKTFDPETFQVIAIAAEPRIEEKGPAFFERLGIDALELYSDPQLQFSMQLGGAKNLPLTIIYNANGTEIGRLSGAADWHSDDAQNLISALILAQ